MANKLTGLSLFSGAGGMDIGFEKAGYEIVWANDFDKAACETYAENIGFIEHGDINSYIPALKKYRGVDVVFGGPPCQGFSVAGKMDPNDERSQLVWSFFEVVKELKPRAFVMENVKALAENARFTDLREELIVSFKSLGYDVSLSVLVASDYGVPQKRERMFLVGTQNKKAAHLFTNILSEFKTKPRSVRDAIAHLGLPGSKDNAFVCNAGITLASAPILRKSPYAGMLFNGAGRPLDLERPSSTLPASMGGNKTPIIDQSLMDDPKAEDWIKKYHQHLMNGGKPHEWKSTPKHLRRLTVNEALLLQTFPKDFVIKGSKSSAYRLIGNAVPCLLAETVAKALRKMLELDKDEITSLTQQIFIQTNATLPLFSSQAA